MGYAICEDIGLSQIRLVYKLPINKTVAACGQQSLQNVCKMNLSKKKKGSTNLNEEVSILRHCSSNYLLSLSILWG